MDDEKIMMASKLKNNTIKKTQQEDLPNGWIKVHLENIATIILGQSPPSSTYNKEENGFPFFQGKADFGQLHPTVRTWCTAPKKISEKNDILISVRAPVGSTNISTNTCCIGRGLSAIRPLEIADMMYVFYHLRYLENHISQKGTGTTFKAITGKQLRSIELSLSPLPEQQRIVAKIESIFAQIDAARDSLLKIQSKLKSGPASLQALRTSTLKQAFEGKLVPQDPNDEPAEMLLKKINNDPDKIIFEKKNIPKGWVKVLLNEISEINPKKPNSDMIEDSLEVSFVPMKCVEELTGNVDLSMTKNYANVRKGYTYFKNGDIIFAKITPCMENGKVAIMHDLKNGIGFGSTEFHVIRLNDDLDHNLYFYYLIQDGFRNHAQINMKGTAGQLRVPTDYLKEVIVPIPPINEQKRIVAKIESIFGRIDAIEEQVESSLIKLEQLKKIILKKAFEGKLVHQDPNDEPASVLLEKIKQEKSQIHKK